MAQRPFLRLLSELCCWLAGMPTMILLVILDISHFHQSLFLRLMTVTFLLSCLLGKQSLIFLLSYDEGFFEEIGI